jgi:hypothetical protein
VSDFDPTMIARWELLPRITSRIAAPEAQHRAVEVYFAAVDQLFSKAELPACGHDRTPRPEVPAAGTYVCVFHPDRLLCFLCIMSHSVDPSEHEVDTSWNCSACGQGSEDLESINLTLDGPSGQLTLTGFKTCPMCGGRPTLD